MIPKTISIKINGREYTLDEGWNLEINTKTNPGEVTLIWESPEFDFPKTETVTWDRCQTFRLNEHLEFRVNKNKIPDKVVIELYSYHHHPVLENTTICDLSEYNAWESREVPITENECFRKNLRKYFKLNET